MKRLMILASLAALAASAMAYDIVWISDWGVVSHQSPTLDVLDSNAIAVAQDTSVLWQLISTGADDVISPPDLNAAHYVGGNDKWIDERLIGKGGSDPWDAFLYIEQSPLPAVSKSEITYQYSADNPYYVYQRVYEGAVPAEGMYYYDTEPVRLPDGGITTIYVDAAGGNAAVKPNLIVQGASPTIPEPATMSLLGLGALAMVLRRKLRK